MQFFTILHVFVTCFREIKFCKKNDGKKRNYKKTTEWIKWSLSNFGCLKAKEGPFSTYFMKKPSQTTSRQQKTKAGRLQFASNRVHMLGRLAQEFNMEYKCSG